jgi:hypothetical protein
MSDRELLELAAKAAGYKIQGDVDYMIAQPGHLKGGYVIRNDRGGDSCWNPLTDDGDALRLAVKLNLFIFHSWTYAKGEDIPYANVVVDNAEQKVPSGEIKGNDPYAATRRAIVRAAAEIGKGQA